MSDKVEGEAIFTVKSTDGQDVMDALRTALARHPHLEVLADYGDRQISRITLDTYDTKAGPVEYLHLETDQIIIPLDDLPEEDDEEDDQE